VLHSKNAARDGSSDSPEARVAARRKDIAPLVNDLIEWMKRERGKLSRHNNVAGHELHAQTCRSLYSFLFAGHCSGSIALLLYCIYIRSCC
jgi:hypothetical protein